LNEAGDSIQVRKIGSRVAADLFDGATTYGSLSITTGVLEPDSDHKRKILRIQSTTLKK
jgi:hypothetical protein